MIDGPAHAIRPDLARLLQAVQASGEVIMTDREGVFDEAVGINLVADWASSS